MVNIPIKAAPKMVVFTKRKLLYNKFQIMLDQAIFLNRNALFRRLLDIMVKSNGQIIGTYNSSNKYTAQLRFKKLKLDQVLPVYIVQFFWSIKSPGTR